MAFEAKLVLEVDDILQDYSRRLPAEVEITNPRHPLAGQRVPVVSGYRWHGRAWLTVTFPDGYPARIPVQDRLLFAHFCTKVYEHVLRPLMASDRPNAPPELAVALDTLDQLAAGSVVRARLPTAA